MSKKIIIAIILIFIALLPNVSSFADAQTDNEQINQYKIEAKFNEQKNILKANETITYTNNEGKNLENIYLHLYPNHFENKEDVGPLTNYPNGFDPGYTEIKEIKINGRSITSQEYQISNTILQIEEKISRKEKVKIDISFEVKIPNAIARFGYHKGVYYLGNWYPILAVHEKEWKTQQYNKVGDPFYSEISNYEVNLTVPTEFKVAHTGKTLETKSKNKEKILKISAKKVRDFALTMSERYLKKEKEIEIEDETINVEVLALNNKSLENGLSIGSKGLKFYSEEFGKYPYKQFTIASTYLPGGMEYPQLVFIGSTLLENNPEYVTLHEIGHQWWYGVVGNNQATNPWIDESTTEYSTELYYLNEDKPTFRENIKDTISKLEFYHYHGVESSINNISFENYIRSIYNKGKLMHYSHGELIGHEKYSEILSSLYKDHKFQVIDTEEYISYIDNKTSINSTDIYKSWLKDGYLDYAIKNASITKENDQFIVETEVINKGGAKFPNKLVFKAEDKEYEKNISTSTGVFTYRFDKNITEINLELSGLKKQDIKPENNVKQFTAKNSTNQTNNKNPANQEEKNNYLIFLIPLLIVIGALVIRRLINEK